MAAFSGSLPTLAAILKARPALLERGLYIESEGEGYSISPINLAAIRGYSNILEFLLAKGADPSFRGHEFAGTIPINHGPGAVSCLLQACKSSDALALPLTVKESGTCDYSTCFDLLLPYATLNTGFECLGAPALLKKFLKHISKDLIDHTDLDGLSLIERAVVENRTEEVRILSKYSKRVTPVVFQYC